MKTQKKDSDGNEIEEWAWDCWGGIQTQIDKVMLFKYTCVHEYDECSTGDISCEHFEHYNLDSFASRVQASKFVRAWPNQMHNLQSLIFNTYYNQYGEQCECGVGTKLRRT